MKDSSSSAAARRACGSALQVGVPASVRRPQLLLACLLSLSALSACEGGALICLVEDQDDLDLAVDDVCSEIRILSWPDDELVVEQESTAPGRGISMGAANVKVMHARNFDGVNFAGGLSLEEFYGVGVRAVPLNRMEHLRRVDFDFAPVAENEPPERTLFLFFLSALEELQVAGDAPNSPSAPKSYPGSR